MLHGNLSHMVCSTMHRSPLLHQISFPHIISLAGGCCKLAHISQDAYCLQFLVLVFLKRNTPPLLLVLLNYMRLFRLLRLVRLLKVSHARVPSPAGSTFWTLSPGTSILIESSVACFAAVLSVEAACMSSARVKVILQLVLLVW